MNDPLTAPPPAAAPEQPAAAAPPVENVVDFQDFARLKLRVGLIQSAEKIEKSKKLLKLMVDLGPEFGVRQILAGIALFYGPEQLVGRRIVVVANLKPAKLMGLESQGMLLAAVAPDQSRLALLDPGPDLPPGTPVS